MLVAGRALEVLTGYHEKTCNDFEVWKELANVGHALLEKQKQKQENYMLKFTHTVINVSLFINNAVTMCFIN